MPTGEMTLHEAAESLGVHYMTVYRYVRLGSLPAHKSGGTWRVDQADVEGLRGGGAAPVAGGTRRKAPWAARLEARLLAGDGRGAWGVVEAALAAGAEPDQIYLDILAPAMAAIGTRWEAGEIDVFVEHRASGLATRLMGRLGPRFVRRGRPRGAVILGAPPGERHALPLAMVADLVRLAGWEVSDLGADVPVESFVRVANETAGLVAVGVGVATALPLPEAAAVLAAVRAAVDDSVALIVGGGAVVDLAHARELGADLYASDARSFVALLDDLARAPSSK